MSARLPLEKSLVDEDAQGNSGHFAALHPAQRARGEVARIGVRLLHGRVDRGEKRLRARKISPRAATVTGWESRRGTAPIVFTFPGGIIAHQPIAPRDRSREHPLLVVQDDGGAVDLLLADEGQLRSALRASCRSRR